MIYWLTGIIGSGKSTLGAALAASLPNTRFIDGDYYGLADPDETFEQKLDRKHQVLADACSEACQKDRSLVVAYPLNIQRANTLRGLLPDQKLIIIGLNAPTDAVTRTYSEWEQQRQNKMILCNGQDFADLMFTHPSIYPYDSLRALIGQLRLTTTV